MAQLVKDPALSPRQFAAVVQVQFLAQELSNATDTAKTNKQTNKQAGTSIK